MARTGRKSKYTPETVAKVAQAIELGSSKTMACQFASISDQTFYVWMREKPDFVDAVKKAEATAQLKWLARIEEAAEEGQWQAAAWKLERRFPDQFSKRIENNVSLNTQDIAMKMANAIGIDVAELLAVAQQLVTMLEE